MEALLFIAIGGAIAFFIFSQINQTANKKLANESLLAKDNIDSFIHYKKRIQQTSYYENREVYNKLNLKIYELTCEFIEEHRKILISDTAWTKIKNNQENYFEVEKEFTENQQGWRIARTLKIEDESSDVLLALAMLCFLHKDTINNMKILRNSFFTNRAIEYLIEVRKFNAASLAKGLILRYGVQPCAMPDTKQSNQIFESLLNNYPHLRNDINNSYRLAVLNKIPPADKIQSTSEEWLTHEAISERIKHYHPSNINGSSNP